MIADWYGWWVRAVIDVAHSVPGPLAYWTTVPLVLVGAALPLVAAFYVLCLPVILGGHVVRWRRRRTGADQ